MKTQDELHNKLDDLFYDSLDQTSLDSLLEQGLDLNYRGGWADCLFNAALTNNPNNIELLLKKMVQIPIISLKILMNLFWIGLILSVSF